MGTKLSTKLSVVIPAYNEEKTIGHVLNAVLGLDLSSEGVEKEIIVVDDGSLEPHSSVRLFPGISRFSPEIPINLLFSAIYT